MAGRVRPGRHERGLPDARGLLHPARPVRSRRAQDARPWGVFAGRDERPISWLDVYVQDDTSVDFLTLEVCYIPPGPFDLAAHKTRGHGMYSLAVTNVRSHGWTCTSRTTRAWTS